MDWIGKDGLSFVSSDLRWSYKTKTIKALEEVELAPDLNSPMLKSAQSNVDLSLGVEYCKCYKRGCLPLLCTINEFTMR